LVEAYITHADDLEQVSTALIPPLLEAVLVDYNQNLPEARDHEVLDTMTAIIRKLGARITDQVPAIMSSVFACTLEMINRDMAEYPEHRVSFFKMIQAINMNCFPALLQLPSSDFALFLDSIVWAFKHTMRDVADTGLVVCLELINNFAASSIEASNTFFEQHYIRLLQDVFVVLTDTEHKAGFKNQCILLARLIGLVETNAIQVPLYSSDPQVPPGTPNSVFLKDFLVKLMKSAFPHLAPVQIQVFVNGLFSLHADQNRFKVNVRDFLIELKEFAGQDNAELYLEEREASLISGDITQRNGVATSAGAKAMEDD